VSDDIPCVDELLWDARPGGLFLGGAPFNVASHLNALVYGSLAQRAPVPPDDPAPLGGRSPARLRRQPRPPFDDRSAVEASLRAADVVKCNDGEPRRLQDWF
jgi:fructokinase